MYHGDIKEHAKNIPLYTITTEEDEEIVLTGGHDTSNNNPDNNRDKVEGDYKNAIEL